MKQVALFPLLLLTACVSAPSTDESGTTRPSLADPTDPSETTDPCGGLDETTCRTTAGCHADYHDQSIDDVSVFSFASCAGPAPLDGEDCWSLDEATCAQHDDCTTVHKVYDDGSILFADCENEDGSPPGKDPGDPDGGGSGDDGGCDH